MHPLFRYYGGKWAVAKHSPRPRYGRIIEPFAGGAGYSLRYAHLSVTLYEIDPVICGLWKYLIRVKPSEIEKLPIKVDHVDEIKAPEEAKWLVGFWLNSASSQPCKQPSSWFKSGSRPNSFWGAAVQRHIAFQVAHIKHWRVFNRSYESAPDVKATWFIDPPYSTKAGQSYKYKIDGYKELGSWCRARKGLVVVCEQQGATWLPFVPFRVVMTAKGKQKIEHISREVVWIRDSQDSKFGLMKQFDLF